MCGADLSDVENENMKDDQDNSQRKRPKKDMDDKTRAINSSHPFSDNDVQSPHILLIK
jgi:hypothetical protein